MIKKSSLKQLKVYYYFNKLIFFYDFCPLNLYKRNRKNYVFHLETQTIFSFITIYKIFALFFYNNYRTKILILQGNKIQKE